MIFVEKLILDDLLIFQLPARIHWCLFSFTITIDHPNCRIFFRKFRNIFNFIFVRICQHPKRSNSIILRPICKPNFIFFGGILCHFIKEITRLNNNRLALFGLRFDFFDNLASFGCFVRGFRKSALKINFKIPINKKRQHKNRKQTGYFSFFFPDYTN